MGRADGQYEAAHPALAAELQRRWAGELPRGWDQVLPTIGADKGQLATRQASAQTLTALVGVLPELVGGSADLAGSTGTVLKQGGTSDPAARDARSTGACEST
jgi:transketolase